MRKRLSVNLGLFVIVLLSGAAARAQSTAAEEYKFEAGGHFTVLNTRIPDRIDFTNVQCVTAPCPPLIASFSGPRENQPGLGGHIGYNLTAHVTVEAEVNFFPEAGSFRVPESFRGGHKIEGLFGVKAGKRFDKVGIFAKARPGFLYASKGDLRQPQGFACIAIFPPPAACLETISKTSFALDLGGVVEFYPTRRTIIRLDAGDTLVKLDDRIVSGIPTLPPPLSRPTYPVAVRVAAETTHNFQGSVGISFRF